MTREAIGRGGPGARRRGRPLAVLIGSALAIAVATSSSAGRAAAAVEPVALVYEAPAACPGGAELLREITRRTRRARAAREGERARILHVKIVRAGGALVGHLQIEDSGVLSGAREVRGEACREVVEALGLVGALAVDREAQVGRTGPADDDAEPPGPSSADDDAPAAASPSGSASPASSTSPESADTATETDGAGLPKRFGLGIQGEAAALADVVLGLRLFGEMQLGLPKPRVLAPSLRLVVARTAAVAPTDPRDRARLRWTQAALEGCPLRFDLARSFELRPCAGVSLGVVEAESSGVPNARSRTRPWASIELHGRAVWSPAPGLALELEAGAVAPLVRETFVLQPSLFVYEAPAVAFVGRGGVSVRFP